MITVLPPAKINLGLEILGKRADGFHEIRTILCAVSVLDKLEIHECDSGGFRTDNASLMDDNLVVRALELAAGAMQLKHPPAATLRKRIPVAAGLAGASSDAAAALLALRRLHPGSLDDGMLHDLASRLGSDVPFFLRAGLANASGRGDVLERLPYQRVDVVIVSPAISIPGKTAMMYGSLAPLDFTDGVAVDELASSFRRGQPLATDARMPNAFARPLTASIPDLIELANRIAAVSKLPSQLSGAGPSHYVLCRDSEHRQWLRNRLRGVLPSTRTRVLAARSVSTPLVHES